MTKKKSSSLSVRQIFLSGSKLVISLSAILCIYAFFRIRSPSPFPSPLVLVKHREQPFDGPPKIAFLFLARKDLPLDFVWDTFFETANSPNFSIYIHSQPGFVFDQTTTRSSFFYGRQLTPSIRVSWGESSMIEAERLLLQHALHDPANQRFVLLSDSCVPLYNFSYIYSYLMSSPKSFVDSFLDGKGGRYNPKMSHVIPKGKWRKGSQWIALVRKHAEAIVDEEVILPVFKRYCKRRPPIDPSKGRKNIVLQKQHNCIPDEHYVQTLLSMGELEHELERRTLTYTLWNQSTTKLDKTAWHPVTFTYSKAGPQQIKDIKAVQDEQVLKRYMDEDNTTPTSVKTFFCNYIMGRPTRIFYKQLQYTNSFSTKIGQAGLDSTSVCTVVAEDINHVYYESEYRTEWCQTNSTAVPCFLFARKFSRAAAMRLLSEGVVGSFDVATLLDAHA